MRTGTAKLDRAEMRWSQTQNLRERVRTAFSDGTYVYGWKPRSSPGRPLATGRDEVLAAHLEGLTLGQIAERVNVSRDTVRRALKSVDVTSPAPVADPEKLAQAAALVADGASFADIIRTTRLDRSTLDRHFPGEQWTMAERDEYTRTRRA